MKKKFIYCGCSSKGEYEKQTKVESLCDFIENFGEPSTPLEIYLFRCVKGSLLLNRDVYVIRVKEPDRIMEVCHKFEKIFNEENQYETSLSAGVVIHPEYYGEEQKYGE